ncbi:MAG: acyl carrier protein [Bacteroidetes bacterium]|nr:MAG: acyl carrier protein [Bacteroidota bacterium]RLD46795.1 MAG: acyl carrier protein [Bacteroidota bacterium]
MTKQNMVTEADLQRIKREVKEVIINALNIKKINPDEIDDSAPLFAPGNAFGLDSVDAIDIIMRIQGHFNVRIGDQNLARDVLESVDTLAAFIVKEKSS